MASSGLGGDSKSVERDRGGKGVFCTPVPLVSLCSTCQREKV